MSELKNSSVVSIASPHLLVGGPPVHAHAALALLLAVVVVEVEPALDQSQVSSGRHVTALSQSQLTWTRTCHWMQKAAMSMLRERAERPYFFRKVIRKPKPTKIITCTSWKSRNQPIENLNYLHTQYLFPTRPSFQDHVVGMIHSITKLPVVRGVLESCLRIVSKHQQR